jgi:isoleucyl-tRNA synthetase
VSGREFPAVPGGYPFPRLELEVLERWRRDDTFRRSLELPAPRGEWVFYEGPPTANNVPHVGHVVTRVVKDLFPRYRTMRGFRVARKAGWDTHGLAVEIEVEKRLGFSGKQQIEAFGIAEFNAVCLESVHSYERQWRAMTERVGYWTDLDDAYWTYSNEYIESVWWSLAELWRQGLLAQDYKIQPYCARCGTTLSSHEVAQNYKDAEDPSVWVLFPARPGQEVPTVDGGTSAIGPETSFVAWTTTPWTLTAHVALVAHPEMVYRIVEHPTKPGTRLIFGDEIDKPVPLEIDAEGGKRRRLDLREQPAIARVRGRDLEGLRYDRPFRVGNPDRLPAEPWPAFADRLPSDEHGWRVVLADYVTASEGTGIVHTSLPFGEDDYATGQRYRLPFYLTVDGQGKIADKPGLEPFAGMWFKEADPPITKDIRQRGLLLHGERYRHNYPFCWRCDSPLLYYASLSWFIRTTRYRETLVAKNRTIDWHPPHVGEGRFGNWLENVVDWALSRKRYWGTPLPVWQCEACGTSECIGSYAALFERAGQPLPANVFDRSQFDPHRPFIDAMTWPCRAEACAGTMRRVEEVIDAWYDSGAMPFAQHHYMGQPLPVFDPAAAAPAGGRRGFPAHWISEAIDQTRGWFYTLHVLGVLLFDSVAFESCIVLGHVNDEQGRKMSKRLGNVVEPMAVIEETGADALRWYFYVNNPEQPSRFSGPLVREAAQRFLLPLWNSLSFFTIYANLDGWHPVGSHPERRPTLPLAERDELDRWILLRLDELVEKTTGALDSYDITLAARQLEAFVDDLTNWYIRRSRARFWGALATTATKEAAYQTLHEVLATLARLLAPFTPFLAEKLHDHLVRSQDGSAPASVHLEPWPEPRGHAAELGVEAQRLTQRMQFVQRVVSLGRSARNTHEIKTRQPLQAVTLIARHEEEVFPWLQGPGGELVREELNVKEIRFGERSADFVRHEVRPNFRLLGKRLGPLMPKVKAALEAADGDALSTELEERGTITLDVDGQPLTLGRDEVEVRLEEKPGLATAGDRELLVALDTALTPELVAEGWAREVVHRIQAARKDASLDYADRIRVRFHAHPELAAAIATHGEWIAGETLAVELERVDQPLDGMTSAPVETHPFDFTISALVHSN